MTCAIREGAEAKIWNRLDFFRSLKRARRRQMPLNVGVLGVCVCLSHKENNHAPRVQRSRSKWLESMEIISKT